MDRWNQLERILESSFGDETLFFNSVDVGSSEDLSQSKTTLRVCGVDKREREKEILDGLDDSVPFIWEKRESSPESEFRDAKKQSEIMLVMHAFRRDSFQSMN